MDDITIILLKLAQSISLSSTADETVRREYNSLGELLSESDEFNHEVEIKPQGSFNLGTSIKPLNGSDDDFDVDLVVVLTNEKSAKSTKKSVGNVLEQSTRYHDKLESEKKRAWTITYANSHVDVVPAIKCDKSDIFITNRDNQGNYSYLPSSPFSFKEWFEERSAGIVQKIDKTRSTTGVKESIEQPDIFKERTILQQVVQLLKFHRNKMFENTDSELKPISMILTVLAGSAYQQESDLTVALQNVVLNLRGQIKRDAFGDHILNPVDPSEDFADKWHEYPERKKAFYSWIYQVEKDFGHILEITMIDFSKSLKPVFGEKRTIDVFNYLGEKRAKQQKKQSVLNSINSEEQEINRKLKIDFLNKILDISSSKGSIAVNESGELRPWVYIPKEILFRKQSYIEKMGGGSVYYYTKNKYPFSINSFTANPNCLLLAKDVNYKNQFEFRLITGGPNETFKNEFSPLLNLGWRKSEIGYGTKIEELQNLNMSLISS